MYPVCREPDRVRSFALGLQAPDPRKESEEKVHKVGFRRTMLEIASTQSGFYFYLFVNNLVSKRCQTVSMENCYGGKKNGVHKGVSRLVFQ